MPDVQVLHEEYKDKGVVVLAMNCNDDNQKATDFWNKKGYGFPSLHDADELPAQYKVQAFPTYHLIGIDGKIVDTAIGSIKQLKPALDKYLEEQEG